LERIHSDLIGESRKSNSSRGETNSGRSSDVAPNGIISAEDFRCAARRRLPRVLFDYVDGGAYGEVTLRRNKRDMEQLQLRQRVMCDVSSIQLGSTLFGEAVNLPIALGPVGFAGMLSRRGEVAAARAANNAGVPFVLSTAGICSIDELCRSVSPPWTQLYMIRDRGFMIDFMHRAQLLGSKVLLFTVDLPTTAIRYRDIRSGMAVRQRWGGSVRQAIDVLIHPKWLLNVYVRGRPHAFGNLSSVMGRLRSFADAAAWVKSNFDASVTWSDIQFVRDHWQGTIVVKGILDVADAKDAVATGVDGLVVSNHGGRQLDSSRSSISALAPIVDAVGDRLCVMVDGGISSGLDVLKAVASGAKACLLGRAWAFALAADGEAGVAKLLARLREELRVAMMLTGCTDVRSANRDLLDRNPHGLFWQDAS
jgi:L-lactate dehydrogenase (cytochrome)